jgi:hypothetical protein
MSVTADPDDPILGSHAGGTPEIRDTVPLCG